jgi:nicotinate-nucleotide--dimethylbenzimidazole phosphoribosyltransferase
MNSTHPSEPIISAPTIPLAPAIENSPLFERSQTLTMPAGALNALIEPVLKITAANQAHEINVEAFLFAGDHGVAAEAAVSAYPSEITGLMVQNFLSGGAAMSVLCRSQNCPLTVFDVGVKPQNGSKRPYEIATQPKVDFEDWNVPSQFPQSYPHGSRNIVDNFAIIQNDYENLFQRARVWAFQRVQTRKLNAVILGDMGIGNTTPAAALACWSFGLEPENAVGTGTGISNGQKSQKIHCVQRSLERHKAFEEKLTNKGSWESSMNALCSLGGFEFAGIAGAFVGCIEAGCYVILDGVISTSAVAPIVVSHPSVLEWCLAGHLSSEPAHKAMLSKLNLRPFLSLDLRLGEGSGAAFALGLLRNAKTLIDQMSTFDDLLPKKGG